MQRPGVGLTSRDKGILGLRVEACDVVDEIGSLATFWRPVVLRPPAPRVTLPALEPAGVGVIDGDEPPLLFSPHTPEVAQHVHRQLASLGEIRQRSDSGATVVLGIAAGVDAQPLGQVVEVAADAAL